MIIESDNELRSREPQVHRVMIDGVQVATLDAYPLDAGMDDPNDQIVAPAEDIIYLAEIRVSPEHRRKGVMRSVINRLAEQGRPIVISPLPLGTERDPQLELAHALMPKI